MPSTGAAPVGSLILEGKFKWDDDPDSFELTCPALSVAPGQVMGIVGRVGAGKSSMLRAMLRELPIENNARSECTGKIAYCPQVAWVQRVGIHTVQLTIVTACFHVALPFALSCLTLSLFTTCVQW